MTQKVLRPIALDESFRTTEQNPQNIADVLANKLDAIKSAIENGGSGEMEAAFECHYNVTSATDIYNAMQDKKVPFFYQNGVVAQLWKVETNKYTFRTTSTRVVEGENILDIVDYIVNGSVWSTATKTISGGSSSQQAYLAKVESSVNFDTTGLSGMQSIISVNDVPADGVYQLSIFMCITPKTASATKSDLVFQFTGTSGTGMPNTTFHAVVDDSQTFGQQLSFSTTLNLKAGTNTLKMECGGLNTEYIVFVDNLTVAQLVNGVYHNGDSFSDIHLLTEATSFNNDDGVVIDGANGGPRFMLWQTLANKVLGFIKNLSTTITAFRSGDYIAVDGPSGTAKMSKDDLLQVTAENAVDAATVPIDESVKSVEILQNLYYSLATTDVGYPIVSGGKITGYGTQGWWAHAIIDKDEGLFVGFDYTTGVSDYIWYIDDNGVILGKYSTSYAGLAIVRKVPLCFPAGATKAVIASGNLGGNSYGLQIYVWKYAGISEERKNTIENLKKLPMVSSAQVASDGFPTFNGVNCHNGYGTQAYWHHAEITAGKGKFVSFYVSTAAVYLHYLDADGIKVAEESFPQNYGFVEKHPLNFPVESTKVIVMSFNNPDGRGEIVLHELCDTEKVNGDVYATIESLNPDLEPVDVQNYDGYVNRSDGYVTNFGTQTYWKHVAITKQEGLFVNFMVNSNDVPVITYVDDSEKIIKEELFSGTNQKSFVNVPIVFPEASTKCYVQSIYGAPVLQEVKVFRAKKAYLPSYWNEAIESYAHAISEETRKIENGCAFIFITDLHFGEYNENHAGRIINKLLEKTSVPFAISGGDYIYAVGDDAYEFEKELALTRKFIGDVGKDNLFQVRGNHDFSMHYGSTSSPDGAILAKAGTNDYLLSNLRSDVVMNKAHTCYYYDHKYSDTRFILVNSCDDYVASDDYDEVTEIGYNITDEQLSFIADAVYGADGKHVVVISHIAADSALSGYSSSQLPIHNLLVSAKNHTTFSNGSVTKDFTSWTGTIVMQVSGHAHTDGDAYTDGILSVLTNCDARLGTNRQLGTIREQCFDVFIADYDNSIVKVIRIGAGSDRTFTY